MSKKRGPEITFTETGVHVAFRDRTLDIPVYESDEADALIDLETVTHWPDGAEIGMEDLTVILEAIEEAAEDDGLDIEFEWTPRSGRGIMYHRPAPKLRDGAWHLSEWCPV